MIKIFYTENKILKTKDIVLSSFEEKMLANTKLKNWAKNTTEIVTPQDEILADLFETLIDPIIDALPYDINFEFLDYIVF